MADSLTLQRFTQGQWVDLASVGLTGDSTLGIAAPSLTAYVMDYWLQNRDRRDAAALSAALPVSFDVYRRPRWPAFLLDLLPHGYGRGELLRRLNQPEDAGPTADWALIKAGAGNPIGHLRVREAFEWLEEHRERREHPGFSFAQVAARADDFIEYLAGEGFFVAGSSGVQGEWPKLLLTEDAAGRLHLDHALADDAARRHWLVKFSRGADGALEQILALEAPYMRLARLLGARVHGELELHHRTLFIPRFDRQIGARGLVRIAQESIASLCGIAEFGLALSHDRIVAALAEVVTDPQAEIIEYVRRDVLNVALGNRDNHLRNTALQRFEDGTIRLTPLFDFAPMMLHPDGIARRSRWEGEQGSNPDWPRVVQQCQEATSLPLVNLPSALRELRARFERLPELSVEAGVPESILERQSLALDAVRASLAEI
jgi:serine/threonine-protein kinase HipA